MNPAEFQALQQSQSKSSHPFNPPRVASSSSLTSDQLARANVLDEIVEAEISTTKFDGANQIASSPSPDDSLDIDSDSDVRESDEAAQNDPIDRILNMAHAIERLAIAVKGLPIEIARGALGQVLTAISEGPPRIEGTGKMAITMAGRRSPSLPVSVAPSMSTAQPHSYYQPHPRPLSMTPAAVAQRERRDRIALTEVDKRQIKIEALKKARAAKALKAAARGSSVVTPAKSMKSAMMPRGRARRQRGP